jgi:xylan 1,4-beta-xylosidase
VSAGNWWAVFLASGPYENVHYNTGRETFLLPVTWRNGWPSILTRGAVIPYVAGAPRVAPLPDDPPDQAPLSGNFVWRDEFDSAPLKPEWLYLRVPREPWVDLSSRPGWLAIRARPVPLEARDNPSFLARRQQHLSFDASTELEIPAAAAVAAGLAAFQSENAWYFLAVRRGAAQVAPAPSLPVELFLEKRGGEQTQVVARTWLKDDARIRLRISGNGGVYSFYFDEDGAGWMPLKEEDDGSILSTDVAGGFVGAFVGPYARAE